jgi:excisionase family DNA binding protein
MELTNEGATSELMTAGEAARALGISVQTVRSWADRGVLAATRTEGGMRLYRRVDVERYATERSQRNGRA